MLVLFSTDRFAIGLAATIDTNEFAQLVVNMLTEKKVQIEITNKLVFIRLIFFMYKLRNED